MILKNELKLKDHDTKINIILRTRNSKPIVKEEAKTESE